MVVFSQDLREVRTSTMIAPLNVSVTDGALDVDDNLIFVGDAPFPQEGAGLVWTSAFIARISADGTTLMNFKNLEESPRPRKLALTADGGAWLASQAVGSIFPVRGGLGRAYSGTNLLSWQPSTGEWTASLQPELSLATQTQLFGHASRPGEFLALSLGRLYRSENSGTSWNLVEKPNLPSGLVWSWSDPASLYTWESLQIFNSTDNGANWRRLELPANALWAGTISLFAVSATNSKHIAFRTFGGRATFVSSDGGLTWDRPIDDSTRIPNRVGQVAVESGPDGIASLILIDIRGGVWKYTESEWNQLSESREPELSAITFHTAVTPPLISANRGASTLIISRDNGQSWSSQDACEVNLGPCRLAINPGRPQEWWIYNRKAWRSVDGGQTWELKTRDPVANTILSMAFSGTEESTVVASTFLLPDVYLQRLDANWEVQTATYWGGTGDENPVAILPESDGTLTLVTTTNSPDYPLTPDSQDSSQSRVSLRAGISRLLDFANSVLSSTTWGGSFADEVSSARLLPDGGGIVWCGSTYTTDQPGVVEPTPSTGSFARHAFVGGLDLRNNSWLPTYILGTALTIGTDCAALPDGRWILSGTTNDDSFPLVNSTLPGSGSGSRGFVSVIRR